MLAKFTIEETLERVGEDESVAFRLLSELGELIGLSREGEKISTSYDYEGNNPKEIIAKTFKVGTAEHGNFIFTIRIKDVLTGFSVEKKVEITII